MKTTIHRSKERGFADHGWLKAYHSFSFADYYNPLRNNFGAIRVLNDDSIEGGKGFGTHPHDNMEIITIPFEGALEHSDSMGNNGVIEAGEIQVMSAGTGIMHSEFNHRKDENVNLFQIWIFPKTKGVTPRYDQITINDLKTENSLYQILSPDKDDQGTWIHQDAWFYMADCSEVTELEHRLNQKSNGVYLIVIEGSLKLDNETLSRRDAVGITDTEVVKFTAGSGTRLLLMEVPLSW